MKSQTPVIEVEKTPAQCMGESPFLSPTKSLKIQYLMPILILFDFELNVTVLVLKINTAEDSLIKIPV